MCGVRAGTHLQNLSDKRLNNEVKVRHKYKYMTDFFLTQTAGEVGDEEDEEVF